MIHWGNNMAKLMSHFRDIDDSVGCLSPKGFHNYVDNYYGIKTDGTLPPEKWAAEVIKRAGIE